MWSLEEPIHQQLSCKGHFTLVLKRTDCRYVLLLVGLELLLGSWVECLGGPGCWVVEEEAAF